NTMFITYNQIKDEETGEIMLKIPTNIKLHVVDDNLISKVREILTDKPTLLFLLDYNHPQRRLIGGNE
ncbi:271_t:CDS:1, partial [Scutellospora calospora]